MDQRTEEWYKVRLGKATASRFSDIMATVKSGEAAARRNYRAELVIERLTCSKAEGYINAAMQWGIDMEPVAKDAYIAETGNDVVSEFFVEHPLLMAGCSPDGYIGNNGLLEIKCPNSATHIETLRTEDIPNQYYWQIMGQLWITGREWADFVSFDPRLPGNANLFIKRLARNEQQIARLENEVAEFLQTVDEEVEFIRTYENQQGG